MTLKSKTLSLELLVSVMEKSGPTFSSKKEFKEIVQEHLCDSILKNSVSTDKSVFSYSLGIFIFLVQVIPSLCLNMAGQSLQRCSQG